MKTKKRAAKRIKRRPPRQPYDPAPEPPITHYSERRGI